MNNSDRDAEIAVLDQFAKRSDILMEIFISMKDEWNPEPPPPYIVIFSYAEKITQDGLIPTSIITTILEDAERFVEDGGSAADLVAVGFFEALLGRASAGRFDFGRIINLLGPKSLEFCQAWDEFTGCTTVADALRETPRS